MHAYRAVTVDFGAPCCVSKAGVELKQSIPIVKSADHGTCATRVRYR